MKGNNSTPEGVVQASLESEKTWHKIRPREKYLATVVLVGRSTSSPPHQRCPLKPGEWDALRVLTTLMFVSSEKREYSWNVKY